MFSWSLILIGPFSCSSAFALHETVELSIGNFDLEKNCGAQNSKCTACVWSSDLNFELHGFRLQILYVLSETLELRTRHRWSSGAFFNRTPRSQNHGSYRSKRIPGGQNYGSYCSKRPKPWELSLKTKPQRPSGRSSHGNGSPVAICRSSQKIQKYRVIFPRQNVKPLEVCYTRISTNKRPQSIKRSIYQSINQPMKSNQHK